MKRFFSVNYLVLLFLIGGSTSICVAQSVTPVDDRPPVESYPPPTEALASFSPFVGLYEFSGGFMGQEYKGTLEVKSAVKGYYVEWIIDFGMGTLDNHFERQLRMLTTWDRVNNVYRIWRFETNAQEIMGEGRAHFDGNDFIMEWDMLSPEGKPGTFRNIVSMNDRNQLIIKSEGELDEGGVEMLGVGTGARRL